MWKEEQTGATHRSRACGAENRFDTSKYADDRCTIYAVANASVVLKFPIARLNFPLSSLANLMNHCSSLKTMGLDFT